VCRNMSKGMNSKRVGGALVAFISPGQAKYEKYRGCVSSQESAHIRTLLLNSIFKVLLIKKNLFRLPERAVGGTCHGLLKKRGVFQFNTGAKRPRIGASIGVFDKIQLRNC